MKALKRKMTFLALAVLLAGQPLVAQEQEKNDEPNLVRSWSVTPKAGSVDEFNAALKAHFAWRAEHEDPWTWGVYRAATGEMNGRVLIRSGGHTFADLDAYTESAFAASASEHFNLTVMPHVAELSAHLIRNDPEMSRWSDEERDYRVFWVTRFHIRPGHSAPFRAAAMAIKSKVEEAGRARDHGWSWAMDGDHLATAILVSPSENWAGHAPDKKSVWAALVETVGEEDAQGMVDEFYAHVESVSADVFVRTKEFAAQ